MWQRPRLRTLSITTPLMPNATPFRWVGHTSGIMVAVSISMTTALPHAPHIVKIGMVDKAAMLHGSVVILGQAGGPT